MNQYTVVLQRPLDIADPRVFPDVYVAHVEAETIREAQAKARDEVLNADREDIEGFDDFDFVPRDYTHVVTLEGHAKLLWSGN